MLDGERTQIFQYTQTFAIGLFLKRDFEFAWYISNYMEFQSFYPSMFNQKMLCTKKKCGTKVSIKRERKV